MIFLIVLDDSTTSHAEIARAVAPGGPDRVFRGAVQLVVLEAAKRGPQWGYQANDESSNIPLPPLKQKQDAHGLTRCW